MRIRDGRVLDTDLFVHFPVPMARAPDHVIARCSTMLLFEDELLWRTGAADRVFRVAASNPSNATGSSRMSGLASPTP